MPREPDGALRTEDGQVQLDLAVLLERCGTGDREAFAAVYDRVAGRVNGLTRRIVRDAAQAEEVTQEVLLDVWRKAAAFDPSRGSALSWVLMIAHRRSVDRVRASQSQSARDDGYESHRPPQLADPTAEDATDRVRSVAVRAAVAQLSEGQRRALEMAYFEGRTHREIAEELEIPLGTAKTRVRDGLRHLRQTLREEGERDER